MRLQSKRKFCSCGGAILRYKERFSQVTIYTETGPIMVEHLECRCKECNKGFFYGYTSDSSSEDQECKSTSKRNFKIYDEDCLEAEVLKLLLEVAKTTFNLYSSFSSPQGKQDLLRSFCMK